MFVVGGCYWLLLFILFVIEVQFFGESFFVGYLFNGFYYGVIMVLLYLVLLQLFCLQWGQVKVYFVVLVVSLLFVVYFIYMEVVVNVKGWDEIFILLGSFGVFYFFFCVFYDKKLFYNIFVGLVFFLVLMVKENVIMFLFVVLLVYYFFIFVKIGEIIKQALFFVIVVGVFLAIWFLVLGFGLSDLFMEMMNNFFVKVQGNGYIVFMVQECFVMVIYFLGKYLQLLFVFVIFIYDYYFWVIGVMIFGDWEVMFSLLFYLVLGVYVLWWFFKCDFMSFVILFYLIILVIVFNLFFLVGMYMVECLLFMFFVGFSLVLVLLGYCWVVKGVFVGKILVFCCFKLVLGVVVGIVFLFGVRMLFCNLVWADNYIFFIIDI